MRELNALKRCLIASCDPPQGSEGNHEVLVLIRKEINTPIYEKVNIFDCYFKIILRLKFRPACMRPQPDIIGG